MKNFWVLFVGMGMALLIGCSEDSFLMPDDEAIMLDQNGISESSLKSAKKPLPKLTGTTVEFYSPETYPFVWVGTIDFSENSNYEKYDFAYELLEFNQKDFANAGFFTENFYVYEGDNTLEGTVYLRGSNSGVLIGGVKFVSNGTVLEASGPFEGWVGRKVHVNGVAVAFDDATGAPVELSSSFRIN